MTKSKKISLLLFSLMLVLASLLFVACGGKDYSKVSLTASQEQLELFIGEENAQSVTFTIENPVKKMDKSLTITLSNPGVCNVTEVSKQGNSTVYSVVGIKGGETDLIARTNEGNISRTIKIVVRQYSSALQPGDNSLYVSKSSQLYPTAVDFVFDSSATERDLDFYFYGKVNENTNLTLDDITFEENFINSFISVDLITVEDNDYLIFTDESGQKYTLGSSNTNIEGNKTKYEFLQVEETNGQINIDTTEATSVQAGDKFTFVAINYIEEDEIIYCQRDFYVLKDINSESMTHEFGYKINEYDYTMGSDYLYKLEGISNEEITLIPNYTTEIRDGIYAGSTVNFLTAYLAVTMESENELLNIAFNTDDANIINAKKMGELKADGKTTYYFELNCNTSKASLTNFNVNFYYEGFENSEDSNVNFTYTIPLKIRIIPTNLLINNVDLSTTDVVYTFYNNYAGASFGWQRFGFSVNPEGAEITNITIDLRNSDLQLKYNNTTYVEEVVTLPNLNEPIYLKGANNAELTTDNKKLPITLNFNVLQEGQLTVELEYQIVRGATIIDYKTEAFKERIYLDLNNEEPILFNDIYADAQFASIAITNISGSDVARFYVDEEEPYKLEGDKYVLNMSIRAIAYGTGTYSVELDNGKQTSITITTEESLNKVSIQSQNQQNSIEYLENQISEDRSSTLLYVYNKEGQNTYFDVEVIGNNNRNSNAIKNVQFDFTSQIIQLGEAVNNNKNFNVYTRANGSSQLEIIVSGYIINNFAIESINMSYYLDIVAFDYINNLNVFKERDGKGEYIDEGSTNGYGINAAYADVYSGTNISSARTAKFNVTVDNTEAYLFAAPSTLSSNNVVYVENTYNDSFLYWETDVLVRKDGVPVQIMYYDSSAQSNVYTLLGVGTFDTSTLTFTSFADANASNVKLIAHVRQYGKIYSYTINVRISVYEEVNDITITEGVTELEFTSSERTKSIIAYPTNLTATNGEIVALFEGSPIRIDNGDGTFSSYNMLDEDSIQYIESDGKYQIIFTVNDDYVQYAESYTEDMSGIIYIVAKDWLDDGNNIISHQDQVRTIYVNFANGTEQNRFTIENADDLVNMNLSAHYKISTNIDVSNVSDKFPLGNLKGSIIGTNEYAEISGINIFNKKTMSNGSDSTNDYYGLFTTIDSEAYIEYVTFSGEFNIGEADNEGSYAQASSYIGMVAGVNNGNLINIGVEIDKSTVNLRSGAFGGVVGVNNGTILQDYTLFEDDSSNTRTYTKDQLNNVDGTSGVVGAGRISYASLTPKILSYMNEQIAVNYIVNQDADDGTSIGGVTGVNAGNIRKIDSEKLSFAGYSNYIAYTQIKSNQIAFSDSKVSLRNTAYVGGLAGRSEATSSITSGFNKYDNGLSFVLYEEYINDTSSNARYNYEAGKGIIVGGEIYGYDYVGGVVGYIDSIGGNGITATEFTGITSRVLVRGLLSSVTTTSRQASIAGIAFIDDAASTVNTAYALQAVDQGGIGINASMLVLYSDKNDSNYYEDVSKNIANSNRLAFGTTAIQINAMYGVEGESKGDKTYTNVYTYAVSRTHDLLEGTSMPINAMNSSSYYGDFIIVGIENNREVLIGQSFFVEGSEKSLSLNATFKNRLTAEGLEDSVLGQKEIYYMFYFAVADHSDEDYDYDDKDEKGNQELLDKYMNNVNYGTTLYPFSMNGEMVFTSKTRDVLTIDQNGRITVNKTGLAQISATSVLNTNNALEFYIYVVNYFNPDIKEFAKEEDQANFEEISIIYPNGSANSSPINDSTINLRGENSMTLYVRPHYSLYYKLTSIDGKEHSFESTKDGKVTLDNSVFNLASNTIVSAQITNITKTGADGTIEQAIKELDVNVSGQTITLRRNSDTTETDYKLEITPRLIYTFTETDASNTPVNVEYKTDVNKKLSDVIVNYRKGASSLNNANYNDVTLLTSKKVEDTIFITSTALEENPYYYIVGLNNENIQGSEELKRLFDFTYLYDTDNFLFNIDFKADSTNEEGSVQKFSMTIEVNKNSQAYKDRYKENIYGQYTIYILAQSNTSIYKAITINFERTNITSTIVDNYSNLSEATGSTGISSTSNYAYPGTTGLLSITVTPEDSDFDYILIENEDINYEQGHSVANFGFLARNANVAGGDGDKIFDDESIIGSATAKGLKIYLEDIIRIYNDTEIVDKEGSVDKYYNYNGVIYIKYDMGSLNVVDGSVSTIRITLMKDGEVAHSVTKDLTIKLQNYVTVELDGKTPTSQNQGGYYAYYKVARGLRYKLNINSYGFSTANISAPILSSDTLATITEENGEYYLNITDSTIPYPSNTFEITISATQTEGNIQRTASSKTHITINEYVLEYNGENVTGTEDIVTGMGEGVVNVQVGTQTTLGIDLYDYIEYDADNIEVVNKINEFLNSMAQKGDWKVNTNLITDTQPDYGEAKPERKVYYVGYDYNDDNNLLTARTGTNYYFNYNGLNIIPTKTHTPEENFYNFSFYVKYEEQNGVYIAIAEEEIDEGEDYFKIGQNSVHTQFRFNVYTSSSEESPIPIYDYEDFLDMQSGGYYILLNDITLPNTSNESTGVEAFVPQAARFKSFDGNGHTINFSGRYDMGSLDTIGLFTELEEESIIRNLNVNFTAASDGSDVNIDQNDEYGWYGLRTVKFVTTAESFNFGAIVSDNRGIITNCNVYTDTVNGSEYYVVVQADNAMAGSSYVGGIAATNTGYITNCAVSINSKTPYNMAGVVVQNSGKIAATYFKGGKLINNSQQNQHVAGFVVNNSENGQIITSYVSGEQTNSSLYSQDRDSYIASTIAAAGFVYQNTGSISDCYTDIYLAYTTSDMSGFAHYNGGTITNCFSLSILRNNVTASAGFSRYNTQDNRSGTYKNCYYFYNIERTAGEDETGNVDDEGFLLGIGDINTSVVQITYEGIERLNAGGFSNLTENFAEYSYQRNIGTNAVWFYTSNNTSTNFVNYIPTTEKVTIEGEKGKNQTNTIYREEIMVFGLNRLELVSPNVDTLSIRNFSYSEVDESSGNIIYYYIDDANTPNRGSLHNPRLIYDANTMESEILEQNSSTNLNTTNYRLISDIDYTEFEGLSGLYKTVYAGVFEGNGMSINQISLVSMENLTNAGLFAQIGYSANRTGAVKNLTINPNQVAFTNTNSVGTLAGTLRYGYIYDITIGGKSGSGGSEGSESSTKVVSGLNFVGGVVGRAINSYAMKDISSNINVAASFSSSASNQYSEDSNNLSQYSYAGSIAGFIGTGSAHSIVSNNTTSIMGSRTGFAFGGIGRGARAEYVYVDVQTQSSVKAYHYGGYVAGEVVGTLDHVYVSNNGNMESNFSVVPSAALAVGGITGVLSGGTISNAVMEQSFRVTGISNNSSVVNYVGGIAGVVTRAGTYTSNIKDSIVTADIESSSVLGGAVGQIENYLVINGMAVKSSTLSVTGQKANPYIGGIIGSLVNANNSGLTMTNSYSTSDLKITTNTSGIDSMAYAGGLIGYQASGRVPRLAYCYTTASVEAEIVDLRSLDSTSDFDIVDSVAGDKADMASFTYAINNTQSNNVYYIGHSTADTMNASEGKTIYTTSRNFGTTFTTKVLNASISLTVNNYGTSSLKYSQDLLRGSGGVDEKNFYNLFSESFEVDKIIDKGESKVYEDLLYDYMTQQEGGRFILDSNNHIPYNKDTGYYELTIDYDIDKFESLNLEFSNGYMATTYIINDVDYVYEYVASPGNGLTAGNYLVNKAANDANKKYYKEIKLEVEESNKTLKLISAVSTNEDIVIESLQVKKQLHIKENATIEEGASINKIEELSDSNGNSYQRIFYNHNGTTCLAYKNIITNEIYADIDKSGKYVLVSPTASGTQIAEIPTNPVWITSTTALSTLAFEDDLDWIKR